MLHSSNENIDQKNIQTNQRKKGNLNMPRKKTFVDNQFEGHPLCNVPREFSYDYIRTIVDLVSTMTERHSKVLVARFDLRYPQGYEAEGSNRDFSTTMQAVCRDFSQKKYDPQYVARREQQNSRNPHYHVGLVLNGNKKRSIHDVRATIEKHWAEQLQIPLSEVQEKALVYPCNRAPDGSHRPNGRMINRNSLNVHTQTEETIRQLSYLGKIDGNDATDPSTRKFFASQFYKDYSRTMTLKRYWSERRAGASSSGSIPSE